jgi:hypothetical protein
MYFLDASWVVTNLTSTISELQSFAPVDAWGGCPHIRSHGCRAGVVALRHGGKMLQLNNQCLLQNPAS